MRRAIISAPHARRDAAEMQRAAGRGRWRAVVAVAALVLASVAPAAAQPAVFADFDCAAGHAFAGFGLNVWALPGRQQPLLDLSRQLQVKYVRWKILPDTEGADVPEGGEFGDLVGWLERLAVAQHDVSPDGGFETLDRLRSLSIRQLAVSWAVPQKWRVAVPAAPGLTERPIAEAHVEDYGRLLAAAVAVLQRHGIRPEAIELLNEPVNKLTPARYARVLQSFRSWQSRSGLPATPVAGAGTVATVGNRPYLDELARQGRSLEIVSTHAYDSIATHKLVSVAPLIAAIPPGWHRPIFVTEYGIDPKVWQVSVDSLPYAVLSAAQTLALLGSGANAVFYWQAQDPPWARPPFWGLLSQQDKPRPSIDALRTIVRPLQVDDRIAAAGQPAAALPVMLVVRPSQLLLEIANPSAGDRDYRISLRRCGAAPLTVGHSETWPAGRTIAAQPSASNELRLTLPGETVATISLTGRR